MNIDYPKIIETKYPSAKVDPIFGNVGLEVRQKIVRRLFHRPTGEFQENGEPILEEVEVNGPSTDPTDAEIFITLWALPDPQPTIDELDAYAASAEYAAVVLAEAKRWAVAEIQHQAEATRAKFITNTPGKVGEYTLKKGEVQRWAAAGRPAAPVPSEYPIAVAEAAEYGISTQVMLAIWEERAAAWEQASARIAAIERRALLAIEAAETVEAVAEAMAGIGGLWPEP